MLNARVHTFVRARSLPPTLSSGTGGGARVHANMHSGKISNAYVNTRSHFV